MERPFYVLHIISNANDIFSQKTCSMCVNDFIEEYVGHFEQGRWISDEYTGDIVYHREYLDSGYAPPAIIVDLIRWMHYYNLWSPWMSQFDQIALIKQFHDSLGA